MESVTNIGRQLYVVEEQREEYLRLLNKKGVIDNFEAQMYRKDGSKIWISLNSRAVRDDSGNVRYFEGILEDITKRKRAEEELQDSEKRFKLAAESSTDLIYEWDIKERIDWFGKIDELLGYSPSEFPRTVEAWMNSVHPEDRDRVVAAVKNHLEKNKPYNIEYRVRKKDGTYNYWWVRGNAVRDEKGNPHRWVGAITDVTQRKWVENTLRVSENKYRTLIENIPQKIFLKDKDGIYISCNNHYAQDLKIELNEILGRTDFDFYPKELAEKYTVDDKRILEVGKTEELEEKYIQDGQEVWVNTVKTPVKDEKSNIIGILGIFWDITERKQAEEALIESEEKYRTILENIEDGYFEVDIAGNFTFFNDSLCQILGYSRDEMMGMNNRQYTDNENDKKLYQAFNKIYSTGEPTKEFDWEIIRKDGTKRYIEASISLIKHISPQPIGFRGIVRDITERKRAEKEMAEVQEQLLQSQKFEAIGQLAGGIAHDFNNLLMVIKGYNQLSLLEVKEDHPLRINMEAIGRASEKATGLVRQLLTFSRRQVMEMKVIDLNMLITDLDTMLRRVIGEDIELTIQLAEDLGRVKTDSGQIEQVILNLAVNARDAMPSGGKLTIETANKELDEEYAQRHVAMKPGRYVMFSVSDTGVGITPEVRNRVFEPFFTTKGVGKGTGLGLSMAYGIVKESRGNIWVYSEPGRGTTFKIYLPWMDNPLKERITRVLAEESPRGHETILIVEDQEEVRKLTVQILKRQGYALFEASHGEEAMKVAQEHAEEEIDLLLTDVVMPGMSGRELAEKLGSLLPKMKVIYMSGYTDDAIVRHGIIEKGVNYLQKPFTLDSLTRKVREVLDK
jgi:PAS domain S-box-containing protein